jgi:hypothetical protein
VIRRSGTVGKALLYFFPSKFTRLGLNLIKRGSSKQAIFFFFFLFPCFCLLGLRASTDVLETKALAEKKTNRYSYKFNV